jgi:CRP/FNR family transcriptional regulator, anaerobic regulatory protein
MNSTLKSFQEKQRKLNIPCDGCLSYGNCPYKSLNLHQQKQFVHKFKIKKGDPIFHNGDKISSICNIKIGFAKIGFVLPNGQYQISQFAIPGDLIGLDGIADRKYHLNAYALSDGEICSIPFTELNKIIGIDPEAAVVIKKYMSEILISMQEHIFSLGTHSAEKKLAYFLLKFRNRLSQQTMRMDTLRLPMSREDLRSHLGVTIETLSRSFTYLEKNGYIEVKNREINFIDDKALENFVTTERQTTKLSQQFYGARKYT